MKEIELTVGFPKSRPVEVRVNNKMSVNFKLLIHEEAIYRSPDRGCN